MTIVPENAVDEENPLPLAEHFLLLHHAQGEINEVEVAE